MRARGDTRARVHLTQELKKFNVTGKKALTDKELADQSAAWQVHAPCTRNERQGFSRPPPLDSRPGEGSGPGPRRRTRTSKGDPDLEGATVGEPSGAASGGLVAHSRCHVPGGLSAARWHTHGARGSRLCTMRITPDHATPRPVCPQAMPEAVRVFRPVALAPGGLGSQRYQVWCDMRV